MDRLLLQARELIFATEPIVAAWIILMSMLIGFWLGKGTKILIKTIHHKVTKESVKTEDLLS